MQRLLLVSSMLLALSACSDKPAPAPEKAAAPAPATTAPAAPPALITRDALFGNPERANVSISPDGKYLSWVAPLEGVLNVWVAPVDAPDQARAITKDTARGIRNYFWTYQPNTLLYLRDNGGDEDFHLFSVNLTDGSSKDLTPFKKTNAEVYRVSAQHPESIMVGMNDRDAKWHDLYRVDLASGKRTLVQKNTGSLDAYLLDGGYQLRYATRATDDAGRELLVPDGDGWKSVDRIPFEDVTNTAPEGLTEDGKTLYMQDSRNRDTAALYAIDTASNTRTLLFENPRADVGATLNDPKTGAVQAVSTDYLREEWKPLDNGIAADLQKLKSLGGGDASVAARTLDDRIWIVGYSAAETPLTYYRYDRADGGKLTKLFSARPALEGKPLVPMWPQELTARDGLKLISYLTLPAEADANHDGKADKPVPLVLFVHGGPWHVRGPGPVRRRGGRHRPRVRRGMRDRRQRCHRQGRHLLPDDGEEAFARAGDRAAKPAAVHLSGRFRRCIPAVAGRSVSGPRSLRAHLLQPGQSVRPRHPADCMCDGIVHRWRRLCAGNER